MYAPKKKSALIILSAAIVVALIFKLWAAMSPIEQWILYESSETAPIGEFVSYEACSAELQKIQKPVGCRRVDGPFNLLNKIADVIFR